MADIQTIVTQETIQNQIFSIRGKQLALVTTLSFGQENNSYRSSLKKLIQISGTEVAYL